MKKVYLFQGAVKRLTARHVQGHSAPEAQLEENKGKVSLKNYLTLLLLSLLIGYTSVSSKTAVNHDLNFSKSEEEARARLAESPFHSLFRNQENRESPTPKAQQAQTEELTTKEIFEVYDSANRGRGW